MKRAITRFASILISICFFAGNTFAAESKPNYQLIRKTQFEIQSGITVEATEYTIEQSASNKTATKKMSYKSGGTTIATITVTATFRYTGSSVTVVTKSYSKTVYNGWAFSKSSFSASGGKVALKGSLNKNGEGSVPTSISITCDKNGHIS